jgi:hypothetical protein
MSNAIETTAPATIVNVGHGTEFKVEGQLGVWSFGSVAGYAAKCYLESCTNYNQSTRNMDRDMVYSLSDAIAQAVKQETERGHALVWASRQAAVIASDPVYRERFQAKLALIPTLALGTLVRIEGQVYTLEAMRGNRDHLKLVPVQA